MSVVYPSSIINERLQIVASAIDAAGGNGVLRLLNSANSVLSSLQLARPAVTVSGTLMSFNGLALVDPAAAASGVMTVARIEDSAGNIVISGLTVGNAASGGGDITFPTNTVVAGQTVAITQAQITGH
jgi:hypothetical protein